MSLGRRKIRLDDADAWVFNRMADVYQARPAYPPDLLSALVELASQVSLARPRAHFDRARVVDIGAGIGHIALPLAERGLAVTAIEPAVAMLEQLLDAAAARNLTLRAVHAQAEALPLEAASAELAVIADALHFLDAERTGLELARVLVPGGALALVTCEFADTPFMRALSQIMLEAAPRRLRATRGPLAQLCAVAKVALSEPVEFVDHTPLDGAQLERILRTISFIGPAMNSARFAAFSERVHALPEPVWARRFSLRSGRRAA